MTSVSPVSAAALAVLEAARDQQVMVATAESCTGGLIAAALTDLPGSSAVLERGIVSYSNRAKRELLDVPEAVLTAHGAVSEHVARAMAEGLLAQAPVDVTVAVTGIAGPGGGTPTKPVGLVHFASARMGRTTLHERHVFPGDRGDVRHASVMAALTLLHRQITGT